MEIESPRISTFGSAGSGVKLQFSFFAFSAFDPASGLDACEGVCAAVWAAETVRFRRVPVSARIERVVRIILRGFESW
jgi:hypothetical protein